ncbi:MULTISPECIES: hypothetical protein [unclassified Nocardiopsis]|uniref:hypothetical protein n=1 Tax=Nocardiopsis TaxID=2013 RepID=UPI00387A8811
MWALPELRQAWEDEDAAAVVRLVLWNSELSQMKLAQILGLSQSTISDAVSGRSKLKRKSTSDAVFDGLGILRPPDTPSPERPSGTAEPLLELPLAPTAITNGSWLASTDPDDLFTESVSGAVDASGMLWRADLEQRLTSDATRLDPEHLSTPLLRWLVAPPATLTTNTSQAAPEVTTDDVNAIGRACDLFEALDHEFGGGHARTAAVQYLHSEVAPLLRGNFTLETGRALFAASARFAAKTGAMAYDAGLHDIGRRYFLQSLTFAHLGGDRLLGAKALALLSHQANFLGHFRSAVDLARTAKTGAAHHATPAVRAMLAAMEARGLASLGDDHACARALHEMEEAFDQLDPETEPAWMGYFDASEIADESAHCFHDLGHGTSAIDHAHRSISLAPAGFRRSRTFAGLIQAGAHLRLPDADPEAACTLTRTTITHAGTLRSARVRTYITRLRGDLEPYAETRHVRELDEFLADAPLTRR